ncbi:MAG: ATP-dependent helicase/nuclease subunit A [Verrucomicrobiales bacterium]|jgi:ATP-dependent helicase/nuclease subunit A
MTDIDDLIAADTASRKSIEEQLDRTLFVEAGAGTGKTTALVGRIVELVLAEDHGVRCPLSQIAAITFTEAAAAELRERIRISFEDELHAATAAGLTERIERCAQALVDADIAAVSTLHAFAQRLLSEFPVEVGVPPRVEVIDEVRSQLAFDRRWGTFLDSLYEDPQLEEFIVRASILGVKLNGPQLRNIAKQFDDNWDRLLNVEVPEARARPIDFVSVREHIQLVRQLPNECSDPDDLLCMRIRNDFEQIFERFDRAGTDYERLRVLVVIAGLTPGAGGKRPNWGGDVDSIKETCKELFAHCTELKDGVSAETLTRFAGKIAEFTRASADERRSEGLLEFHDLLVLAHILLRDAPDAREALSKRYRVLMLDEFQDTDPIQISLAMLLVSSVDEQSRGTWSTLRPHDGRLFMVGDPKQSIYRFRRADISLFLKARRKFDDGRLLLQRNFRTVSPVIDAVNALFGEIMAEETESQAAYSPLLPDRAPSSADHRPIVFGGSSEKNARKLREDEAADVAALIVDMQENPQSWLVDDGQKGWRAPKLREITILLPTRTSMSQLSHALDDKNIPFRADTGTLVYETQEVKDLLSVLAAIDDPSDEIALVATLRSPLYSCGYDDLYAFGQGGGAFDIRAPIPDALLGSVVAAGIAHLGELSSYRWWDEPSMLLMRIIDDRFAMALPAHGRRARDTWRRLRYVVDQARAFAESGGGDLREYLDWTRLQGADGSKAHEPMLAEPDDDAVQIMTIHGSKGLEFPITIVSGLTTQLGNRGSVGEVIWREAGVMPAVSATSKVSTKHFDLAKELDDEMDGPERERLLYVALTRARDHLVMSGHHAVNAKGVPKDSHGATLHTFAADTGADLVRTPSWQVPLFSPSAQLSSGDEKPTFEVATPAAWRESHRSRIRDGEFRSVWSATAIAQQANGDADDAARHGDWTDDSISDDDEGLNDQQLPPQVFRRGRAGTSIGTAVHAVLQFLDLADISETDIDSLSDAQAWSESVAEHVDTIRASVRSALQAPIVASCETARHWKELFVAAPVGDITVEGYIDLLVETPAGLVVVDYKTDSVKSEAEIDAKLDRYSLQGAAYAMAVEASTGQRVVDVQFVFARAGGPIVRSIDDLDARRRQVESVASTPKV